MGLSKNKLAEVFGQKTTTPITTTPPAWANVTANNPAPAPAPFQFAARQNVEPYQTPQRMPGSGTGAQVAGDPNAVQSFLSSLPPLGQLPPAIPGQQQFPTPVNQQVPAIAAGEPAPPADPNDQLIRDAIARLMGKQN